MSDRRRRSAEAQLSAPRSTFSHRCTNAFCSSEFYPLPAVLRLLVFVALNRAELQRPGSVVSHTQQIVTRKRCCKNCRREWLLCSVPSWQHRADGANHRRIKKALPAPSLAFQAALITFRSHLGLPISVIYT